MIKRKTNIGNNRKIEWAVHQQKEEEISKSGLASRTRKIERDRNKHYEARSKNNDEK